MTGKNVRVLSIDRGADPRTGGDVYSVSFGESIEVTDVIRARLKGAGAKPEDFPSRIGFPELVLNSSFKDIVPYRVGTVWELSVSETGEISLAEVKSK